MMRWLLLFLFIVPASAQNYQSMILQTPGLVGYWRLGEASGNFADSSTNGSTATAPGSGLTYGVTGAILNSANKAISLSASSGPDVSNQTPYNFNYNQAFSVEFYYIPGTGFTSGNWDLITKSNSTSPYPGWQVHSNNGEMAFYFDSSNASDYIQVQQPSVTLTAGKQYYVVWTYSGSGTAAGFTLYINGVSVTLSTIKDTLSSQSTQTSNDVIIGSRVGNCCESKGTWDEVAIYNVALPAATVTVHFQNAQLFNVPGSSAALPTIYENDVCSDTDNFYALGGFLQFAKLGYFKPLAIIVTGGGAYDAPSYDAEQQYYGFQIPLGAYQGSVANPSVQPGCSAYAGTYNSTKSQSSYVSDAAMWRTTLTAASNNSVYVIEGGGAVGLYDFMNDGQTPSGVTLISEKVKELVWDAGGYTTGSEYNFGGTGGYSQYATYANYVLANWPTTVPIEFISNTTQSPESGGNTIVGGTNIFSIALAGNPLYQILNSSCTPSPTRCANGRPSWDRMPIFRVALDDAISANHLFSVAGANGQNSVNASTGANTWTSTPNDDMSWLQNVYSDYQFLGLVNTYLYQDGHQWSATWQ